MLGFDSYPDLARAPGRRCCTAGRRPRTSRAIGAPCCRSARRGAPPRRSRPPGTPARRPRRPRQARAGPGAVAGPRRIGLRRQASGRRPAGGPAPPGRQPVGAAEARLRLRPPLRVLRDPQLPRRLRLPPAGGRPGRGGLAGRAWACASCCWSARTPPRTARTSAICGRWSRCCRGWPAVPGITRVRVSYLQPAEVRPGLVDVLTGTPGRRPLLRPVLPARLAASAAPDAPLRRDAAVPVPAGADPRARPAGRGPVQRHRRLPRRDRRGPRRARGRSCSAARLDVVGVFGYSDEEGTEAAGLDGKLAAGGDRRAGGAGRRAGRGAVARSGRRTGSGRSVDVLVEEIDGETRRPGRPPGSRRRRGDPVRPGGGGRSRGSDPVGWHRVGARVAPARPSATSSGLGWCAAEGPDLVARLTADSRGAGVTSAGPRPARPRPWGPGTSRTG